MAVIALSDPPDIGEGARYADYKDWLLTNFWLKICAYCLLCHEHVEIDHYIPRQYDASKIDDPNNLLLSCRTCARRKSDYHPLHRERRSRTKDTTGFLIIDVRRDDLGQIYELHQDGSLEARSDSNEVDRAIWNVSELRLDLYDSQRARLLKKLEIVERGLIAIDQADSLSAEIIKDLHDAVQIILHDLAEREPLLRAFDVPMSAQLRARLVALRSERPDG